MMSSLVASDKPTKAQIMESKFAAMTIGKILPNSTTDEEKMKSVMPTPDQLKDQLKDNPKALKLLEHAEFKFKGGEDPKTMSSEDTQVIVFKKYGIYLAGDGSVQDLKK